MSPTREATGPLSNGRIETLTATYRGVWPVSSGLTSIRTQGRRHRQGREGLKAPGLRNNLHSIPDTHPVSRFGVRGTRHKRVESQHDWLHAGIVNFSPCLLLYVCSNLISEIVKRKTKCHHHVWHVTAQRRLHVCNPDWIQMIYSRWWDTLKIENRLFLHPTFYSRKDSERTR